MYKINRNNTRCFHMAQWKHYYLCVHRSHRHNIGEAVSSCSRTYHADLRVIIYSHLLNCIIAQVGSRISYSLFEFCTEVYKITFKKHIIILDYFLIFNVNLPLFHHFSCNETTVQSFYRGVHSFDNIRLCPFSFAATDTILFLY